MGGDGREADAVVARTIDVNSTTLDLFGMILVSPLCISACRFLLDFPL
jgi:hypothetical protein